MKRFLHTQAILILLLLTGCTSLPTDTADSLTATSITPSSSDQQPSAITAWSLKAKIGIKSGNKGNSGTLRWQYSSDQQEIELYGPFGSGRIQITSDGQSAQLKDTKGLEINGNSIEEVLEKRIGWSLPWQRMIAWIRGLQNPDANSVERNDAQQITYLNEDIWHVDFQQYTDVDGRQLPRKMEVTSTAGAKQFYDKKGNYLSDQISAKIIIKSWSDIEVE